MAQKRKDVTYFNVTPAHPTWPILEAQGFTTYCRGLLFSVPALSRGEQDMTVEVVAAAKRGPSSDYRTESEKLRREAEYGNLSLVCHTAKGHFPSFSTLAEAPRVYSDACLAARLLPQCFGLYSLRGPIGRYLLRRGKPVVIVDANGPIAGLVGSLSGSRTAANISRARIAPARRSD